MLEKCHANAAKRHDLRGRIGSTYSAAASATLSCEDIYDWYEKFRSLSRYTEEGPLSHRTVRINGVEDLRLWLSRCASLKPLRYHYYSMTLQSAITTFDRSCRECTAMAGLITQVQ
jgi:hypothetical protein